MSKSNSIAQSKAFSVWTTDWTRVLQQRGCCRKWNKVQWGKYASETWRVKRLYTYIHLSSAYPQLLGWGPEATKLVGLGWSCMEVSPNMLWPSQTFTLTCCLGTGMDVTKEPATIYHDISWHVKIFCFRRKHGYERHNYQISVTLQLQTSDTSWWWHHGLKLRVFQNHLA